MSLQANSRTQTNTGVYAEESPLQNKKQDIIKGALKGAVAVTKLPIEEPPAGNFNESFTSWPSSLGYSDGRGFLDFQIHFRYLVGADVGFHLKRPVKL